MLLKLLIASYELELYQKKKKKDTTPPLTPVLFTNDFSNSSANLCVNVQW